MKRYRLLILLVISQLSAEHVFSQQTLGVAPSNLAKDNSVVAGNFMINRENTERGITEHINVNYAVSPAPFTNFLSLELGTADPTRFSADVVDAKGVRVSHWQPVEKSYHYKETIDISKLRPGNYRLNIYCEYGPAILHSVPFEKVDNKN